MRTSALALRFLGVLLLAASAFSCAETQEPAAQTPGANGTPRARPSARGMDRAVDRVRAEALRCLTPGVAVTVRGVFVGTTGAFTVDALDAPGASFAATTCVRASLGELRVRPFTEASAHYSFTLRADGTVAPPPPAPVANRAPAPPPPPAAPPPPPAPSGPPPGGWPTDRVRAEATMLRECYEQATLRDHTVEGSVTLRFTLDGGGSITSCATHTESPHPDQTLMELVARCIEQHVRVMNFGPQRQPGVEMSVPLTFSNRGVTN